MNHLKDYFFLILCLLFLPLNLLSQTQQVKIKNVNFYFDPDEKEMIITYDLVDHSPIELYEIELTFVDGMNVLIQPKSIAGDVGKDVQGGENKRIIWKIFDDVENVSETARPILQIISVKNKPIDPDLAIIMEQIDRREDQKYHFKMQRDGMLILGVGSGIGAVVCKLKANDFIDEQNKAQNLNDYNQAGDNAQTYHTLSYVLGGASAISIGISLYQYIWGGKVKRSKTAMMITPGINHGFALAVSVRF